ncbi:MAG: tRNA pseudouridine synthase A [Candidatus Hodarchaeota archaeon]
MQFHLYFLKIWYDGTSYHGSQVQPTFKTVDGALVEALKGLEYIPPGHHVDYFKVAGRTDKGVSALGAVYCVKLQKPLHPCEINDFLKKNGHPIMIWSVALLKTPVNPRDAISRAYKYFHVNPSNNLNVENIKRGLEALKGEHEFKGFTKSKIKPGISTRRSIEEASLDINGDLYIFTFHSRGFLWEQVRRMVAFLLEHHNAGEISCMINDVFSTGTQPNLAPAPPEGLILWEIIYGNDITWENLEGCTDQFIKNIRNIYSEMRARSAQFQEIHEKLGKRKD